MNSELEKIIAAEPKFRREQILRARFDPSVNSFDDITTLSKDLRGKLAAVAWSPVELFTLQESKIDDTKKALLRLQDGELIETVLMSRKSKKLASEAISRYTVCVSSQVGCPLGCAFCATGQLGFKRNLSAEEIIGQFVYWQKYLFEKNAGLIDNVVFMGQGEPLLNYEAVKSAANSFIKYAVIGPTKITISSGGVVAGMEKMVVDPDFPPVRFALSLHSAIPDDRKKLMPFQPLDFFEFLFKWAKKYHDRWPSRTHFVGLEYIFISGVNDTDRHYRALLKLASKLGRVRLNFIPLNAAVGQWQGSPMELIKDWQNKLLAAGFIVTVRVSQGSDIAAACGQLKNTYDAGKKK